MFVICISFVSETSHLFIYFKAAYFSVNSLFMSFVCIFGLFYFSPLLVSGQNTHVCTPCTGENRGCNICSCARSFHPGTQALLLEWEAGSQAADGSQLSPSSVVPQWKKVTLTKPPPSWGQCPSSAFFRSVPLTTMQIPLKGNAGQFREGSVAPSGWVCCWLPRPSASMFLPWIFSASDLCQR